MQRTFILGAGHMGSAMALGMLRRGMTGLTIVDPDARKLTRFGGEGIVLSTALGDLAKDDTVVLAMPPQAFAEFASSATSLQAHEGPVISVIAGLRIATIQSMLGCASVLRAIPNTPSEVFEGVTVFCVSTGMSSVLVKRGRQILDAIGKTIEVTEDLIDPATAVCGGGPAFVAYFADAIRHFAVAAGFSEEQSRQIVTQVLKGTAELIEETGKAPMQLCREVMTPNGTTERGIHCFDRAALSAVVDAALVASTRRSKELGDSIANELQAREASTCSR